MPIAASGAVLASAADMVTRYGRAAGAVLRKRADEARRMGNELAAQTSSAIADAADALTWGAVQR